MNKEEFYYHIAQADLFDAHTHLIGARLCAGCFWELAHYFWLLRELQGAGYPANAAELPEEERIGAFLEAYARIRGTAMCYAFSHILSDLYGVTLGSRASVREAIDAVAASSARGDWALEVARRGSIRHAVVNKEEDRVFVGLPGVSVWVPRVDGLLAASARRIWGAANRAAEAEAVGAQWAAQLDDLARRGACGVMTTLPPTISIACRNDGTALSSLGDCYVLLVRGLCAAAQRHGWTVQLFLGVETGEYSQFAAPVDRFDRVLVLYGLFEDYVCPFELVLASAGNNLDAVQAACMFPHVHVGGMWWYNFRPSTYRDAMEKRFEALGCNKSALSISDSRCMEWCYGKNLLIKRMAASFLSAQAEAGCCDYDFALLTAREWLYTAAHRLYSPNPNTIEE